MLRLRLSAMENRENFPHLTHFYFEGALLQLMMMMMMMMMMTTQMRAPSLLLLLLLFVFARK